MCKHSTQEVDQLSKRQRGLDARGNDPMATKRESSWATGFIQNPPGDVLNLTKQHVTSLINYNGNAPATTKLQTAMTQLGTNPTGTQFVEKLLDRNAGFKTAMDEIGGYITKDKALGGLGRKDLEAKGRNLNVFKDRGRNEFVPRSRRQSISNRDAGITTSVDRTGNTQNVFAGNVDHAKGKLRGFQDSETFKQFQKSGAPFIGGASGTVQMIAMEMEHRKPLNKINAQELAEREKVLTMMSAQLVAGGHHSMSECLLAAKAYGYFKNVPDPLTDYDGAMKALEKHLTGLGAGGAAPLSRETEIHGLNDDEVAYKDRRAAVETQYGRFKDQIPAAGKRSIDTHLHKATTAATVPNYRAALSALDKAENAIRSQAALITANAEGNNRVLGADELVAKMGAAPSGKRKESVEYKAVHEALAAFEKSSKELSGRKLDHDSIGMAFEELRASLATAKKAAEKYNEKHAGKKKKANRRGVMTDLIAKLDREMALLIKAEGDVTKAADVDDAGTRASILGDLTMNDAIEYGRFGIALRTQARPDVLKQSRITGKQVLGSGNVNTVSLINYGADGTNPAEVRVFKPEHETEDRLPSPAKNTGIDPNDPRAGKRNIATKKMAVAAGLGGLVPDAEFTIVDGQVGLAMQKAEGKELQKRIPKPLTQPVGNYNDLGEVLAEKNKGNPNWRDFIPKKKDIFGCGFSFNETTQEFEKEVIHARPMPLEAPPAPPAAAQAMQKQLTNMQWLDALCGQADRHADNYLIDTSGAAPVITGIDNDFSFGKDHKNPADPTKSSNILGFPPVIDQATYNSMTQMQWPQIAASLGSELTPEEIAATKDRFDAVQAELARLNTAGMVVADWNAQINGRSVQDILLDPASSGSYYKRDVAIQRGARNAGLELATI